MEVKILPLILVCYLRVDKKPKFCCADWQEECSIKLFFQQT